MKNFKQIALGLMVGALAFSFSAFTHVSSHKSIAHRIVKSGMISDDHIVQNSVNGFVETNSPDASNCSSAVTTRDCIYAVTSTGASNIPDKPSYSAADVDNYVSEGWLTGATSPGVYNF